MSFLGLLAEDVVGHFAFTDFVNHTQKMEEHDVLGGNGDVGFQLGPPVPLGQLLTEEEIAGAFDRLVERAFGVPDHLLPDAGWQTMDLGGLLSGGFSTRCDNF